jgi:hypothetical protein
MITYSIVIEGEATRTTPISDYEIMHMCPGGGLTGNDYMIWLEFFTKDEAIKAQKVLKANGVPLLCDEICETDNPWFVEVNEDE